MTTELNPSPAPEPQGIVQAQSQNGAPQNQQGQHSQGQGQGGHRRRRRRRNKGKGQPNAGAQQNGAPQNQQPSQPSSHQGQQKQKPGKRFFQKSPGNQPNFNGNGFRPMQGNGNGNAGGRRKNKGRRQQTFVGPMDHSYRVANGNVADPSNHQQNNNNDFRGMPHSGFYSEADYLQPVPMREDAPTRIYCFIEDLFFLAKIQEVSKKLGIKVAFVKPDKEEKDKDVIAKLTETSEEDRPALILFDLNNANTKPLTLIPKIRTKLKRSASIIGFLSHVQGDLKNKAIEAGCDTVMPRSTFSQNLPGLLRRYGIIEEAEDEFQAIQA
ncbi:MAG TPA: response regulator [Acidobacteriaceae bacterium]